MFWPKSWTKLRGLLRRSVATSISTLLLYQSFVYSTSQSAQDALPDEVVKALGPSSTTLHEPDYIPNTYLRSNLRENQTGTTLLLQITVLDSNTCAPVENALVEIWGANKDGKYSGSDPGATTKSDSSSWLRGGSSTDSEGVAKFQTIYPGPQPKRAPHLNAIIRADWYEYAQNKTIASDSTEFAAAVGHIFFPDDVNEHVFKNADYKQSLTTGVKNDADPSFKDKSFSLIAETQALSNGVIRAHLTISIDINSPQKFRVESSPDQTESVNAGSNTQAPQSSDGNQTSSAAFSQPSMIFVSLTNLIILYGMNMSRSTRYYFPISIALVVSLSLLKF